MAQNYMYVNDFIYPGISHQWFHKIYSQPTWVNQISIKHFHIYFKKTKKDESACEPVDINDINTG